MKIFKSIFQNKKEEANLELKGEYSSIYDANSQTVKLEDIKGVIQNERKRKLLFTRQTTSILEELKVLYTIHMMLIADQINDFDQERYRIYAKEDNFWKVLRSAKPKNLLGQSHCNPLNSTIAINNYVFEFFRSIIQYDVQFPSQFDDFEKELTKLYYSYLQRAVNNCDIYYSSQRMQYPYQDEYNNRRVQYLWLFKLLNLLNFKLAMIPFIQKIISKQLIISNIVKDITILIYKDCVNEYLFFKKELEEQLEFYSQFSVKDAISFYELFTQLKFVTDRLKLFHNLRQLFIKHEKIREFTWFVLDKQLEKDIETYIQKAKLINTTQFKNSLQVPNQKAAYEHLSKQLQQPKPQKVTQQPTLKGHLLKASIISRKSKEKVAVQTKQLETLLPILITIRISNIFIFYYKTTKNDYFIINHNLRLLITLVFIFYNQILFLSMLYSDQNDYNQFSQVVDISLNSVDQSQSQYEKFQGNAENDLEEQKDVISIQSIRIPFNKVDFIQQPIMAKRIMPAYIKKIDNSYAFYIFDLLLMEATKLGLFNQKFIINSESKTLVGKIKIIDGGKLYVFQDGGMSPKKCTNQAFYRKYLGSICKQNELKCHIPKINQQNNQIYSYSPVYFKKNKEIIQQNNQFFEFYNIFKFSKQNLWSILYKKELTSDHFLIKIQKMDENAFEVLYTAPINHLQAFQISISIIQIIS
ncbi:unnamed protein product (macronuclear) [Paramecium tetraurelia]|uniref:Uncharacterized protein n=1 Tax=Paramecium tetraurelia TaxID=5888 RepID=A0BXP4_PARTE|nr:uncharacterized protein GSPATT00033164001 [Paramecium tetraurelia]CAK63311.1 unnamed protein product [Paramecium tetraurelia]|eukprot:XP_001430709.1 hypothetical protein (macronuclear) [Paramecium tetraurelia strain d4-2]